MFKFNYMFQQYCEKFRKFEQMKYVERYLQVPTLPISV